MNTQPTADQSTIPTPTYWQPDHVCMTPGCEGRVMHVIEIPNPPAHRIYECSACHAREVEYVISRDAIVCPQCDAPQVGTVTQREGDPWATCIHTCDRCGYLIMESEWNMIAGATLPAAPTGAHATLDTGGRERKNDR